MEESIVKYVKSQVRSRVRNGLGGIFLSLLCFIFIYYTSSTEVSAELQGDFEIISILITIAYSFVFIRSIYLLCYIPDFIKQFKAIELRKNQRQPINKSQDALYKDIAFMKRVLNGGYKNDDHKDGLKKLFINFQDKWKNY